MLAVKVLLFEKADPSLVSIKIELTGHLGVIISLLARRRRKYIFLFSRRPNFGELYVRFKLQVDSRFTNLAEIWPDCCQIVWLIPYLANNIVVEDVGGFSY